MMLQQVGLVMFCDFTIVFLSCILTNWLNRGLAKSESLTKQIRQESNEFY